MNMSETKTIRRGVAGLTLAATVLAVAAGTPAKAVPSGYTLSWSDEFSGAVNSQPNSATWNFDTGIGPNNDGWGNWEQQTYTNDVTHCHVISDTGGSDGKVLQIEATNDSNWATYGFHSARINTIGKQLPTYGYIECRAKCPTGQGIWPAFWMLGNNFPTVGWPNCGEMDIMEIFGQNDGTNMGSFHMGTPSARIDWSASYTLPGGAQFNQGYHTFGLLWTSSGVTNYVDGVQYETHSSSSPGWVFNHPFYFIINLAVGGIPPGNVVQGRTTFPQFLDIDYVRVYQPGSGGGGTLTAGSHTLTPQNATGSRLDDNASGTTNGNKIQIWTANGSAAQTWAFATANVVPAGNWNLGVLGPYCLDANGGGSGVATRLWACNGSSSQSWNATKNSNSTYTFKSAASGNCLDVTGAGTANGTVVESYTCNSTNAQQWGVN